MTRNALASAVALGAAIAEFAVYDFVANGRGVDYESRYLDMQTYFGWEPRRLDWSTIGFVPVVQLEIRCPVWESWRGLTPFFAGSETLRTIYIDTDNIRGFPTPTYAPTILHEWVHASIQSYVAESSDPVARRAEFDAIARTSIDDQNNWEDRLSEVIAYNIQWQEFPNSRPAQK